MQLKFGFIVLTAIAIVGCTEKETAAPPVLSVADIPSADIKQDKIEFSIRHKGAPIKFNLKSGLAYSCEVDQKYAHAVLLTLGKSLKNRFPNASIKTAKTGPIAEDTIARVKIDLQPVVSSGTCNNVTCRMEMHMNAKLEVEKRSGEIIESDNFASGNESSTNYLRIGGLCAMVSKLSTKTLSSLLKELPVAVHAGIDKALYQPEAN